MPQDCYNYWSSFGAVNTNPIEEDEDSVLSAFTGFVFPGRALYRDDIRFNKLETSDCNKKYVKSKRFTPGILTVQCCCEKPQLLGYIVMRRAESTGLALTSILTHFRFPPKVVYYDNACNLVRSILVRCPWLMHCTKFVVDRFHYKNHTCCELFDPNSYFWMDMDKNTTAESLNARLEKSVPYLRFLKAENYMPHLNIRFALLNIVTRYRRKHQRDDIDDKDIWEFFRRTINSTCDTCSPDGRDAVKARNTSDYTIFIDAENTGDVSPEALDTAVEHTSEQQATS